MKGNRDADAGGDASAPYSLRRRRQGGKLPHRVKGTSMKLYTAISFESFCVFSLLKNQKRYPKTAPAQSVPGRIDTFPGPARNSRSSGYQDADRFKPAKKPFFHVLSSAALRLAPVSRRCPFLRCCQCPRSSRPPAAECCQSFSSRLSSTEL